MSDKYILDGKNAVPCDDLLAWGKWMQTADRIVAKTDVNGARVSTVFLGLDHAWGGERPMLFETLVFEGDHDSDMERCETWEQAEKQHRQMVEKLQAQ